MKGWISSFFLLLFPRICVVCSTSLIRAEEVICTHCNIQMPRTRYHTMKDNPIEMRLLGLMPVERATAYFYYQKESYFRRIVHELKYKDRKRIGEVMGRYMATEMKNSTFFEGIDVIMPVPLHKKKLRKRGYNQSEWLARGLSQTTGIPVDAGSLIRVVHTDTQTKKRQYDRWQNIQTVFQLTNPAGYTGKHILIVDDVLTTGATIVGCANAFGGVKGVKFSVITLAMTR